MPKKKTRIYNDKRARKYKNLHAMRGTGFAVKRKFKRVKGR